MGCDIHMYIEVQIDGKWFFFGEMGHFRNYTIFYFLAGVRGSLVETITSISSPRGLPGNLSIVVAEEVAIYQGDGHSYSFFSREELLAFTLQIDLLEKEYNWLKELWAKEIIAPIKYLTAEYRGYIEDCRVVFWFDN